ESEPAPELSPMAPLPLPAPVGAPADGRQSEGTRPDKPSKPRPAPSRPMPSPDDEFASVLAVEIAGEARHDVWPLVALAQPRSPVDEPAVPAEPEPTRPSKPKPVKPEPKPDAKPDAKPTKPAPADTAERGDKPAPPAPPPAPSPARAAREAKPAGWPAHLPRGQSTAADFPEPVQVRRVYDLSLTLIKAAFPAPRENGKARMSIWPQRLGLDPWPRYFAWAAGLTELLCGGLVLVGFFTRTAALLLTMTMLTAAWLTTIGPAVASGNTVLWVLPDRVWWTPRDWSVPLWQLAIVAMGLASVSAGPGWLSLDRFFSLAGGGGGGGGGKKKATDEDEE
nr:DoxX family protein [Phycisphaerales bacterium]